MILGGIPLLILAPIFDRDPFAEFTLYGAGAVAYTVLVGNMIGFVLWIKILELIPAPIATISLLPVPMVGIMSGVLILGESVGWQEGVAVLLITTALASTLNLQSKKNVQKPDAAATTEALRPAAEALAATPEPLEPGENFVCCPQVVFRDGIRSKRHGLTVEHILKLAADLQSLLRKPQPGRPFVMGRAFLDQVIGLDHLADVIGRVGTEIVISVREFADGHVVLADMIEDDRLRRVEIAHAFRVEDLTHHFQELAVQPLDHTDRA